MTNTAPHPHPARRLRRGLTLPEVLLILLVLALFAGLLVPLWNKKRERSRRVNCAGNLKQIGLAEMMYSGDCGGYYQITGNGLNLEPLNTGQLLANGKVYACPSASVARTICCYTNYHYRGSGLKDDNDSATIVSSYYDQSGNHPANQWMNACFIDGHVEGTRPDGSKGWNICE